MATRGAGSPFVLMSCSTTRLTDTLTWMGVVPHATNGRVDDYEQCLMRSSTYLPQYAQVHLPRWCRIVHVHVQQPAMWDRVSGLCKLQRLLS